MSFLCKCVYVGGWGEGLIMMSTNIPHSSLKINDDRENTFSLVCFMSETLSNALAHRPLANGGPSDLLRRDGVPLRSPDCKKLK